MSQGILGFLRDWVGWGWGLTGVCWVLGSFFILTTIDKRLKSRIVTAVIIVAWTVLVLAVASAAFGPGPPIRDPR